MNRNGKIARLPRDLRDQLNQRLADGEQGVTLLPWLNGLPDVKELLALHFEGSPISKQNLSEWRSGGFAEWEARQDIFAQTNDLSADAADLSKSTQGVLADDLATLLAARYAALLHTWKGEVNKKLTGKLRVLHGLTSDVAKLRRGDHQNRRWKLQQDLLEEEQESTKEELFDRFWGWAGNPKVREVIARQYARETNDPDVMRKLFGLPPTTPEAAGSVPRAARNPGESAPSQTDSSPVRPESQTTSPGGKASWTACPATAATAAERNDDAAFETAPTHELESDSESSKSGVAPAVAGFPPSPHSRSKRSKTHLSQTESNPVKPITPSEPSSAESTEPAANKEDAAAPEEPVKPSQTNQLNRPSHPQTPLFRAAPFLSRTRPPSGTSATQ